MYLSTAGILHIHIGLLRERVCSKKDKICRCGPVRTLHPRGLTPIYLPGTGGRLRVGKDSEGGRGKKEPLYIYLSIYIYIYIYPCE